MKNLVDRIAGVGFSLALTLTENDCEVSDIVAADYDWRLRGKRSDAMAATDPVAFELTTAGGQITVVDGQVFCAFSPAATEGLSGLYRMQLVGLAAGAAVLGGEPEPLRFVSRF